MVKVHIVHHSVNDYEEPVVRVTFKEFPMRDLATVMAYLRENGFHWKDQEVMRIVMPQQIIEVRTNDY